MVEFIDRCDHIQLTREKQFVAFDRSWTTKNKKSIYDQKLQVFHHTLPNLHENDPRIENFRISLHKHTHTQTTYPSLFRHRSKLDKTQSSPSERAQYEIRFGRSKRIRGFSRKSGIRTYTGAGTHTRDRTGAGGWFERAGQRALIKTILPRCNTAKNWCIKYFVSRRRSVPAPPAPPPPARPPGLGTHSHAVGRAIYSAGRCCYGNPYSKGVGLRLSRGATGPGLRRSPSAFAPQESGRGGFSVRSVSLLMVFRLAPYWKLTIALECQNSGVWDCVVVKAHACRILLLLGCAKGKAAERDARFILFRLLWSVWKNP